MKCLLSLAKHGSAILVMLLRLKREISRLVCCDCRVSMALWIFDFDLLEGQPPQARALFADLLLVKKLSALVKSAGKLPKNVRFHTK